MASFVVDTSGMRDLFKSLDSTAFEGVVADAVAEAANAFDERIRPDTPFDTGRLLLSGQTTVEADSVEFVNDAQDPDRGDESYASFAHFSGAPTGAYAATVEEAFVEELDTNLPGQLERVTARQLNA